MNEKKANLTPAEVLSLSLLGGGGTFGAIRLLQDAMRTGGITKTPGPKTLELDSPQQPPQMQLPGAQHKRANELTNSTPAPPPDIASSGAEAHPHDFMAKAIYTLLGVPTGFMGAKFLYDKFQQKKLQSDLDNTKNQYMQSLQHAKFGSDNTPHVDGVCEEMCNIFNKVALEDNDFSVAHGVWNAAKPVTEPVWGMMKVLMALGAGGSFGAMYLANKNKQEQEQSRKFPEKVKINNTPSPQG